MSFDFILLAFLVLYLTQISILVITVRRLSTGKRSEGRITVSVVIAARDEERNLGLCLDSVFHQTYPNTFFEVIVVDDHSVDGTGQICEEYAKHHKNLRYISAQDNPRLRGKANALDQGIAVAGNEVILITDADCVVPPTWIEETAKLYTPSVGLVGGLTIQHAGSSFEGMQSLDWAYLLGLAAAAISLRIPLSTIGNNLSFRKSVYDEIGGYAKLPFSVTEDFVLFRAIVGLRRWEYLCPIDPRVLVISSPCPTWRELWRQKHRWGTGGRDMNLKGLFVMAIGFGLHGTILSSLALSSAWFAAGALLLKLLGDYFYLSTVLQKLRRSDLMKYFPAFALYFFTYVLALPFVVFFGGRVRWKGRSY